MRQFALCMRDKVKGSQTTGQQGHRQLSPLPDITCDLLDYIISCSLERQTLHLDNAIASKA